jgi:hypothetical protein
MRALIGLFFLLLSCQPKEKSPTTPISAQKTPASTTPKPVPFTPPPLSSLPDMGVKKMVDLGKPVPFKKLCPAPKKNSDESVACLCLEFWEESSNSSMTDDKNSCLIPTYAKVVSFFNGMKLFAKEESTAPDEDSGETDTSAEFSLFIRAREKGVFYTQSVGSASIEPAFGYTSTYTIKNLKYVELLEESLVVVLIHRAGIDVTAEKPMENKLTDGSIILCHSSAKGKVSCTESISLGSGQGEGYELNYILEGENLFLVETSAKTDPELKKTVGKYTLQFP